MYSSKVLTRGEGGSRVEDVGGHAFRVTHVLFLSERFVCGGLMSWNQVEGYWTQLLGRLREYWGVVRHRPMDVINGQRAQVVGLLQRKYGAGEINRDGAMPILEARSDLR